MLVMVWLFPGLMSFMPIFLGWYTTQANLDYLKHHPNVSRDRVIRSAALITLALIVCPPHLLAHRNVSSMLTRRTPW